MEPEPLERYDFDARALVAAHPPALGNRNKRVVYEVACPAGTVHRGRIACTRWGAMAFPTTVDPSAAADAVVARSGYYDYVPTRDLAATMEWHVNFADPHLFAYYGSGLFAQDEMQVAEHPALGALREALVARGLPAVTAGSGGPTPVLVMGVERRCSVETAPIAAAGRPRGLYGNRFAAADPESVRRATTPLDPPTVSNIVAMAAPRPGRGRYTAGQIEVVLVTAFTGFCACALESRRVPGSRSVFVHTGYWGCGAFGGNRVLMALLQAVAAGMAGIGRLVFHTGDTGGDAPLAEAMRLLRTNRGGTTATADLIARIEALGLEWGASDGN